jgi:hypothetical protein
LNRRIKTYNDKGLVDQFGYIIVSARPVACVLNGLLYVRGNSKWADNNVPLYLKKMEDNSRGGDFTDQTLPSGHSRATQYHKTKNQPPLLRYPIDY